jgi:hypothetical protein
MYPHNPHYRGLGWTQLRWMWTTFHIREFMPFTWMTYGLDYMHYEAALKLRPGFVEPSAEQDRAVSRLGGRPPGSER